jgi:hypothetical protein
MEESKIYIDKKPIMNECVKCRRVTLWSTHFKTYVCDDCYAKGLGGDKLEADE